MATARPVLDAATATMPLATLAGIPALIGLQRALQLDAPAPALGNGWYLNTGFFILALCDLYRALERCSPPLRCGRRAAAPPADRAGAVLG